MRCGGDGWGGGLVAPAQGCVKILGKERAGLVSDETEADRQRLRVSFEHIMYQRTPLPRLVPSRVSTGLVGVPTRPAGVPYPWGATSCLFLTDHRWN